MRIINLQLGEGKSTILDRWLRKDLINRVLIVSHSSKYGYNYPSNNKDVRNNVYCYDELGDLSERAKYNPNLLVAVDDMDFVLAKLIGVETSQLCVGALSESKESLFVEKSLC